MDVAQEVIRGFKTAYPDITRYSQYMGMETDAIRTISNRRLPVTRVKGTGERAGDIRAYANVNYMVQSSSRELLASSWMDLEQHYPGIVWLPVHDELVLQIPEGQEREVMDAAEHAMRFDFRGVPISATAIELIDPEGVSRWMPSKTAEEYAKQREKVPA
jgi:DNA polymerase-1